MDLIDSTAINGCAVRTIGRCTVAILNNFTHPVNLFGKYLYENYKRSVIVRISSILFTEHFFKNLFALLVRMYSFYVRFPICSVQHLPFERFSL